MPRTSRPTNQGKAKSSTKKKTDKTFEQDSRYAAAMLKTAFDLRDENNPHFDDILFGIIDGLDIEPKAFENYIDEYRNDLRKNCRKKGYV